MSICDDKFKKYLQYIFKFEIVAKKYLTFNYNKIINNSDNIIEDSKNIKDFINIKKFLEKENPIKINLKCSIINVITYIYLKIPCPFLIQAHLFKFY